MVKDGNFKYFNIIFINVNKWGHRADIDKKLNQLRLEYHTIEKPRISVVKKLILNERPDIVIVGHDRTLLDRLFIKCANSFNIPTLLVQDGIIAASRERTNEELTEYQKLKYLLLIPFRLMKIFLQKSPYSWTQIIEVFLLQVDTRTWGNSGNYGQGECQKMAVFGDATKDLLISEGVDPKRIIVTGNPKFDSLFYYTHNITRKNKLLNTYNNKYIFLLITQPLVEAKIWSIEQRSDFILTIYRSTSAFPNAQLIIKLHPPMEKEDDYYQIIKNLPHPPIICKNMKLPELIDACTVFMAGDSTAALEAMAMRKPVIIINLFDSETNSFYRNSGALFATNENQIKEGIRKILYNSDELDKMSKFIDDFVYNNAYLQDGQSSKRIAELIAHMTTKNGI